MARRARYQPRRVHAVRIVARGTDDPGIVHTHLTYGEALHYVDTYSDAATAVLVTCPHGQPTRPPHHATPRERTPR